MKTKKVYLALGSNEGDRHLLLRLAIRHIEDRVGQLLSVSSFIETDSWGYESHNKYINAVVLVETILSPLEILDNILFIEQKLGRVRDNSIGTERKIYKDRPIDIDILLIDDMVIEEEKLTVPHPFMHERLFVLKPLLEISPNIIEPNTKKKYSEYYQLLIDKQ